MSWFERHLNWTMVLTWVGTYFIVFIVGSLAALIAPNMPEDATAVTAAVLSLILVIAVGQWVLRKKNRSMWWLLLSGTIFFLSIDNHSLERDEYGRTIADYDSLVDLDPQNANAYHERADFYCEVDEYARAIADYSRAIELNPRYASAYFSRAYAYGEMGEYEEAIADYSKAIELDPRDASAYYNRGLDYQNKGQVREAVSDLEKCIGLSDDPELVETARQALSEMKATAHTQPGRLWKPQEEHASR